MVYEEGREKQQKFGILDSPTMYEVDLNAANGPLGTAVLYIDLDNFKTLNARFTETVVDTEVLPAVHKLLRSHAGGLGFAYGVGGDEFKILLPNATLNMATDFAESIRVAIEGLTLAGPLASTRLTASIGVAHEKAGASTETLSLRANQAENFAKRSDKNTVVISSADGFVKYLPGGVYQRKTLTIREKSAAEILASLKGIATSRELSESVEALYLGRGTGEAGWQATVYELPSRHSPESWHCLFREVGSDALVGVTTPQDISALRPGDSVTVSGTIGDVSRLYITLSDATVHENIK